MEIKSYDDHETGIIQLYGSCLSVDLFNSEPGSKRNIEFFNLIENTFNKKFLEFVIKKKT